MSIGNPPHDLIRKIHHLSWVLGNFSSNGWYDEFKKQFPLTSLKNNLDPKKRFTLFVIKLTWVSFYFSSFLIMFLIHVDHNSMFSLFIFSTKSTQSLYKFKYTKLLTRWAEKYSKKLAKDSLSHRLLHQKQVTKFPNHLWANSWAMMVAMKILLGKFVLSSS